MFFPIELEFAVRRTCHVWKDSCVGRWVEPADSKVACPGGAKGQNLPQRFRNRWKRLAMPLGWRNGGFTWIYIHAEHHETEDFRVSQIFTRYSPPRLGSENGDFLLFQQIHKQFEFGHISSIFIISAGYGVRHMGNQDWYSMPCFHVSPVPRRKLAQPG